MRQCSQYDMSSASQKLTKKIENKQDSGNGPGPRARDRAADRRVSLADGRGIFHLLNVPILSGELYSSSRFFS